MSMTEKRADLAALVLSTLEAAEGTQYESDWRVDQHYRGAVLYGMTADDRKKVMGDPARYAVVYHVGEQFDRENGATDILGRPLDTIDRFSIEVWFRFRDHDTLAASSEAEWNTIMTGASGLLQTLRDTAWLDTAAAELGLPSPAIFDIVALASDVEALAHHAAFTIDVK